jgi:hypothetical protein
VTVADDISERLATAERLRERARQLRADGYGVLAGHLRDQAGALAAEAWADAGYGY